MIPVRRRHTQSVPCRRSSPWRTHTDTGGGPYHGEMTPRPVVAAAILDSLAHPTYLLCAARAYPDDLRGRFELPGGKVEAGEDPRGALVREIHEELATRLDLGDKVPGPDGGWWPILQGRRMSVWLAQISPDAPAPTLGASHLELRWVPLMEAAGLDWIGHDRVIVEATVSRTQPPPGE